MNPVNVTWHKDSAGSYYATHDGKRIATARKDGNAWHGTVIGLGHGFTGRRLADVKELAHRHVERIYGEGEWTLFPARELKPGMVLGCDTWKDGEREVTSVSVDTDAQSVDVELSLESSRELGFALDHTYAVGEYVRVRPLEVEVVRAEHLAEGDAVWFYEGKGIVTAVEPVGNNLGQLRVTTLFKGEYGTLTVYPGSTFERVRKAEEAEQAPQGRTLDDPADAQALAECEADQRDAVEAETGERFAPKALGPQTVDLHPFTAVVDVIAGTGVLVSPPAVEDVTLSEGGATLHDSLLADALRRLLPLGVEALEGEDGGLSLEAVTPDGRKVFSLYVSACITTEPDFEEVAASIEALRQAVGL
ncbi:hypothetical protein [Streptomyces hygroscopicus]|uniref:hypothetical protein n=1 Tax=Streptomyces hygroscopicus TaxID=1912 RepID=UPI0004C6A924|nr:hypothetical protein [Streptomyces hygroscopicus]